MEQLIQWLASPAKGIDPMMGIGALLLALGLSGLLSVALRIRARKRKAGKGPAPFRRDSATISPAARLRLEQQMLAADEALHRLEVALVPSVGGSP